MTSAITMQFFTEIYQTIWELVALWVRNIPVRKVKYVNEDMEGSYIWTKTKRI